MIGKSFLILLWNKNLKTNRLMKAQHFYLYKENKYQFPKLNLIINEKNFILILAIPFLSYTQDLNFALNLHK